MTLPLPGGGGELVGSGKFATPCARMHLASVSSWSLRLSDGGPRPAGGCASFPQDCWADLNAGDWVLMSFGTTSPPVALGSGKFGTPWARMHCAYASSGPPLARVPLGLLEDPQAAIAVAQTTAANAADKRLAVGLGWVLVAWSMSLASGSCR
jgi:hypothetical protein